MSKKITFPRDENAHNLIVEWWYLNGNLEDQKGNSYAFMDCLFRVHPKIVDKIPRLAKRHIYFSHWVFSDIKKRKFDYSTSPVIVSNDSFNKKLLYIKYKKFLPLKIINSKFEEISPFIYRLNSGPLDLTLISQKKPLLEGKKGYVHLNTKSTYYYSLTNLKATGTIKIGKKQIPVQGKVWLDHQWANSGASLDKWIWFSIQLDNNTEIVCFEFDDKKVKTRYAGLIDRNNKTSHTSNITFTSNKHSYKSKTTGSTYPLTWKIKIPKLKANLTIKPMIRHQEVIFANINYWEGPITISGTLKSKKVKGKGFMELVGFPRNKSLLKIYTQVGKQILKNNLKRHIKS